MVDAQPVAVAINPDRTRAAIRLYHAKGNCLTADMIAALSAALDQMSENPHLKLLTIEGTGPDFSFGASIPEHAPDRIGDVLPAMHELILQVLDAPVVTACVVRGRCLGGGFELALACDFVFAAEDATFALPEVALGVFPPAAAVLLPWRAGGSRATAAIVTGEPGSARAWHDAGVVSLLAPAARLAQEVDDWFDRCLAPRSAVALRHAAAAARSGLVHRARRDLPRLEDLYLHELMHTADAAEGIAAFLEKRPPRWLDR